MSRVQGCPPETPQKVPIWLNKLLELISWQQPWYTVGTNLAQNISPPSRMPSAAEPWSCYRVAQDERLLAPELVGRPGGEQRITLVARRSILQQMGRLLMWRRLSGAQGQYGHCKAFWLAPLLQQICEKEMHPSCQMHLVLCTCRDNQHGQYFFLSQTSRPEFASLGEVVSQLIKQDKNGSHCPSFLASWYSPISPVGWY